MSVALIREWRTPGCGDACIPRRHDPEAHEAHGAAQERERAQRDMQASVVRTGPLVIDRAAMAATVHGETVALTPCKWRMLDALAERAGRPVAHEEMALAMFGRGWALVERAAIINTLNTHRAVLRARLGAAGSLIVTIPGVGARLEMVPPEDADPLAGAVERANEALDWIEARQGPLREDNFATIETTVGVVRALRRGQGVQP